MLVDKNTASRERGETFLDHKVAQQLDDLARQRKRQKEAKEPPPETTPPHPDYRASRGGTFWIKPGKDGDEYVFLANFCAEIQSETVVDDGAITSRRLEIAGTLATGEKLPLAHVPSGQFSALNWVGTEWGNAAQIAPGIGLKDRLRYAIQVLSTAVQRRSVFAHTGWRELSGQWVYLSNGACISSHGLIEGIDMEMPGSLTDYALADPGLSGAGIAASLRLLDCAPPPISVPLFLAPYRAILCEVLPVDFSLFLAGVTGSCKTEIAALVQAHFGSRWHGKHLPASWSSTANSLEKSAFLAKDAVLTVDDFCPCGSTADIYRYHKDADRLLRAQGNRAGRQRMNEYGGIRPAYFPRGLIVATGEDVPRGQSLRGRLLILEFSKDTVKLPVLTTIQRDAGTGLLATAAGAFCQWLAPRINDLKQTLPPRFREQRTNITATAHSRYGDTLAGLMITAEVFAQFAADSGVPLAPSWLVTITDALIQAGKEQARFIASEEPGRRFIRLIHAALESGLCHVKRKDGKEPAIHDEMSSLGWILKPSGVGEYARSSWHPQGPSIGWFQESNLYLNSDPAYSIAAQFARTQGQALPFSQTAMKQALLNEKFLLSIGNDRLSIKLKLGDGSTKNVLHISRG